MTPAPRRRIGFTLVELLVVITILGVLIALLVPVVWAAVGRANEARVAADINTLSSALASFRAKFQEYPPSRVLLVENGAYGSISGAPYAGMTYAQGYPDIGGRIPPPTPPVPADIDPLTLSQRSISALRKFFPKVQVTTGATAPAGISTSNFYDFNGNRNPDAAAILLEGHECLVFFLGGIPNHDTDGSVFTLNGVSGFSANPRNPFQPPSVTSSTARIEPFFEFSADRLFDDDLDGVPGYVDTLGKLDQARYYAYFSSYEGSGYDPNDVNLNGGTIGESAPLVRSFNLAFPVTGGSGATRQTDSPLPNPYTSSLPVTANGGAATFLDPQSFQIISPGRDRLYGPGGQYTESTNNTRLPDSGGESRVRERDNITSFSNGTLD